MSVYLPLSHRFSQHTYEQLAQLLQDCWGDGLSVDQTVKRFAEFNDGVFLSSEEHQTLISPPEEEEVAPKKVATKTTPKKKEVESDDSQLQGN